MKPGLRTFTQLLAVLSLIQMSACSPAAPADGDNAKGNTSSDSKGADNGQVVLRVMDWSDSVKSLRDEFHKKFMEKYPNIKIEYTQLTVDQFKNTVITAVKTNDAPDLFPVPTGMKLSTLVKDKWFQPLDPYIDDAFKNQFIDGTFQNGTTMVDGKIYSIPEAMSLPSTLVFYNKKLFREAGLDPEKPPATYAEFRDYAQKITAAGKGKYYGIIEGGKQSNRWLSTLREWSSLGGSGLNGNSPVSLATKQPTYDSQAVLDVFGLFKGLAKDGSFHPKTMSISAPEARALFAQDQAGFIIQGAWNVGVWNKDNPKLEYGVMAPPLPESGRKGSIPVTSSGAWIGLSANSKHPKEAALYLKEFYGGDFFQPKRVESGDSFSVVKGVNEKYAKAPQLKAYYDIVQNYGRMIPDPSVRNPDTAAVFSEFKDVHPDAGEILSAVVAGAMKDEKEALAQYSKQLGTAWNSAVEAAKGKGAKVSGADFEFPNWDPMKNYTSEDYKALK